MFKDQIVYIKDSMRANHFANILFCSFLFLSCGHSQVRKNITSDQVADSKSNVQNTDAFIRIYDFDNPSEIYVLDPRLEEISGLSYDTVNNQFLTINDEEGIIYSLDQTTFDVVSINSFAKRGDYEALVLLDEYIVVSKSSGTLYFYNTLTEETTVYKTELSARNDVEGLCFDVKSNSLLMACKEMPLGIGNKRDLKCIYRFDLLTKKLDREPFLTIYDHQLLSLLDSKNLDSSKLKLKKLKRKLKNFAPSGIAIHPITGDYYITSARGSILVILEKNKKLKDIIFLNSKSNPQPEGITFDRDNNLYISTEGKGFGAKVFKFEFKG